MFINSSGRDSVGFSSDGRPQPLVLTQLLENLTTSKAKVTYSTKFLVWTTFLAVASAAIFFFSAQKASEDYVALLPEHGKDASFIFEWIAPVSVALTNTIFNHEVFLNLWGSIEKLWPALLAYLHYMWQHPLVESNAWLVSAATILPFWYISIRDPIEFFIPETISSLLCLFIFYNGAETCYQVAAYPSMQRFWLNIQLCFLSLVAIFFRDNVSLAIENCIHLIEVAKAKSLLVDALEDTYYTFYYTSPDNRKKFVDRLKNNETDLLQALLVHQEDMPLIPNLVYQSNVLLFIKFVIFGAFAMEQNFGHAVESYKAGAELHPVMGVILAAFNLVPSIGFTVKGILGYGPVEMALEIGGWRQSAMQQSAPGYYRWIALMRFSDFFSGFSNNAVNTIGAKDCGASDQVAFWVGLIANIGTVFGFNGPQCELWFQTNIMEYLLAEQFPDEILVQQNLRQLAQKMKSISLQDFKSSVKDPRYFIITSRFFPSNDSAREPLLMPSEDSQEYKV